jgi:hypothetical protein
MKVEVKDFTGTPAEMICHRYSVCFTVKLGAEKEFVPTDFAKFVDITFCIIDQVAGGKCYSKPITFSMN